LLSALSARSAYKADNNAIFEKVRRSLKKKTRVVLGFVRAQRIFCFGGLFCLSWAEPTTYGAITATLLLWAPPTVGAITATPITTK
jgi:hypothetical protein